MRQVYGVLVNCSLLPCFGCKYKEKNHNIATIQQEKTQEKENNKLLNMVNTVWLGLRLVV